MDRVNRLINDSRYQHYLHLNEEAEQGRIYCSHQFEHLLATARLSWIFILESGVPYISREIAYAAALLHDIGRWQECAGKGDHAILSSTLAEPLLRSAGFSRDEIGLITRAISRHRHDPAGQEVYTPLDQALYRADKHSRICFTCEAHHSCHTLDRQPHRDRLEY